MRHLPSNLTPSLSNASADLIRPTWGTAVPIAPNSSPSSTRAYVYSRSGATRKIVLLGDSHALQWSTSVGLIAYQLNANFALLYRLGCFVTYSANVLPQTGPNGQFTDPSICEAFAKAAVNWILKYKPQDIVITLSRTQNQKLYMAGITQMVHALGASGAKVFLIGNNPRPLADPTPCLSIRQSDIRQCATPLSSAIVPVDLALEQSTAAADKVGFVNVIPWLCTTVTCPDVIGTTDVYENQYHLTSTFSKSVAPVLLLAMGLEKS